MAKAKKERGAAATLVNDPADADRELTLGSGKRLEFKANTGKQSFQLTAAEKKELKKKYPYLELK